MVDVQIHAEKISILTQVISLSSLRNSKLPISVNSIFIPDNMHHFAFDLSAFIDRVSSTFIIIGQVSNLTYKHVSPCVITRTFFASYYPLRSTDNVPTNIFTSRKTRFRASSRRRELIVCAFSRARWLRATKFAHLLSRPEPYGSRAHNHIAIKQPTIN